VKTDLPWVLAFIMMSLGLYVLVRQEWTSRTNNEVVKQCRKQCNDHSGFYIIDNKICECHD
jgi:hypothetical protein